MVLEKKVRICTPVTPNREVWSLTRKPSRLTFIGTSYPLQGRDIIIVLANREGEHTHLEKEQNHTKLKTTFRETEQTVGFLLVLLRHSKTIQPPPPVAIRLLSCGSYNALILLSDLASQSIHTTVANTKLQWERCQAEDYSFMLLTGPDSKESQDKYWWGGETGIRGVGEISRLKKKTQTVFQQF